MIEQFDNDTRDKINERLKEYKSFLFERYNKYGSKLTHIPSEMPKMSAHYIALKTFLENPMFGETDVSSIAEITYDLEKEK